MNIRATAEINLPTQLSYTLRVNGVLTNVSSWVKVEIFDVDPIANPTAIPIQTILPAFITNTSTGVYSYVMTAVATAQTYYDKQSFILHLGGPTLVDVEVVSVHDCQAPSPLAITPTAARAYLEGYGITTSILADTWIQNEIDAEIIPYIEKFTRYSITGVKTCVEYYSGNGQSEIMVNRRNVIDLLAVELVSGTDITAIINIASLVFIQPEGKIKIKSGLSEYWMWRIFPKGVDNIKVTYTYGFDSASVPADILMAGIKLTCIRMLDLLEGKTGGGDLTVQAHGRSYGEMGKWTYIRRRLYQGANYTLRQYNTAVVGQ